MRIDVMSLFPEMISDYCDQSIIGIAQKNKLVEIHGHNPRDFTTNKHKCVDDVPYGGGPGMVLSPQPFFDCFEHLVGNLKSLPNSSIQSMDTSKIDQAQISHPANRSYEVIITCPSGRPLNQELAKELSQKENLIILCGRYEGFDQRIRNLASMEVSIGDYVLSGGELAAMTIIDSSVRLIDGVLGDNNSIDIESFEVKNYLEEAQFTKKELAELLERTGLSSKEELEAIKLLEYPQYTRPKDFRNNIVPDVLDSGNHKQILMWRLEQAIKATKEKRPDLL